MSNNLKNSKLLQIVSLQYHNTIILQTNSNNLMNKILIRHYLNIINKRIILNQKHNKLTNQLSYNNKISLRILNILKKIMNNN